MKKLVITLVTLLAAYHFSQAQLSYGARAGLNVSKISFTNDDFKTKFQPGFSIGLYGKYALNKAMAVQVETFFSREGTKEERVSSGTKGNINKSYVQIPLLFQYKFVKGLYAEAGPQFGILVASKEKYGNGNNNIKPYYKPVDIRVPIGVGYDLNDVVKGLSVDLRYSFSLSKINKIAVGGGNLKNQVIGLSAFYNIGQLFAK
ncbi:porin family protein [Terrimonas rubra]|uniref:Porin family protein n=1 Tax=Terrimonas rubra TaxID=1035890 RepID=A0ABW6A6X6_9BACT